MLFHLWLGSYHTQIDFHPIFMPFFIIGPDTRIHTQNMVIADFGANINSDTDIMSVEKDGLPIIWKQLAIRLSLFKQIVPKLSDMLVKMMQHSPFFLSPSIFFSLSKEESFDRKLFAVPWFHSSRFENHPNYFRQNSGTFFVVPESVQFR